jgi:hypothetical protein
MSTALSPLYLSTSASQDIWDSHTKDSGIYHVPRRNRGEFDNQSLWSATQHGPIFTFEMGIILPVHTIGLLSRDPEIR